MLAVNLLHTTNGVVDSRKVAEIHQSRGQHFDVYEKGPPATPRSFFVP
jgi:hypothetical protein